MSDYTKLTDFAAKDALISGNPLKLITGTAHDNEYNAIATAIATKYDSSDIASEAEVDTGTSNAKLITPALLAYALDQLDLAGGLTVISKAAATSRTSTATPANDSELVSGTLQPGTYIVEVQGAFRCNGGTQGYALRFGGTATIRADNDDDSNALVAMLGGNGGAVTGDANYPTVGVSKVTGTTSVNAFSVRARLVVTVAGTVAFQWSQASSSATATELLAGSVMTVEAAV